MTDSNAPQADGQTRPFQFGLKQLLAAVLGICVLLGLYSWLGIFPPLALLVVSLSGFVAWQRRFGEAFIILLVGTTLIWVMLPQIDGGSLSASQSVECLYHLKHITLALQNYHDKHGSFPPAYLVDKNGRPMHSWRVLILPFLDKVERKLYEKYDFNEPWDGPNNSKLATKIPRVFQCPSNYGRGTSLMTSYVVVVGPETAWPGQNTTSLGDMKDGSSNTILVVEAADSGIHWMEPRDFHVLQMDTAINSTSGQGISSKHPRRAHVSLADGSTMSVTQAWTPQAFEAFLSINGGETIDWAAGDASVVVKTK